MDKSPEDLVEAAIKQAIALDDPAERARAITGILDSIHEHRLDLKAARESAVLALRKTLTLREVAELLGVSIGRVDQIAKGK
jgi:DNA-directed RNA polymerase specialized sigma subunit